MLKGQQCGVCALCVQGPGQRRVPGAAQRSSRGTLGGTSARSQICHQGLAGGEC